MITAEVYDRLFRYLYNVNPNWRIGQTHFNLVHIIAPVFAEKYRGSSIDPFNNAYNIQPFIAKLLEEGVII